MNETLRLVLASLAGVAIGAFFFGGLWFTVRRGASAKQPALWFFGSQLLRTGLALSGFYFVSGGEWERLLSCFIGFVFAQMAVTGLTWTKEVSRAP